MKGAIGFARPCGGLPIARPSGVPLLGDTPKPLQTGPGPPSETPKGRWWDRVGTYLALFGEFWDAIGSLLGRYGTLPLGSRRGYRRPDGTERRGFAMKSVSKCLILFHR